MDIGPSARVSPLSAVADVAHVNPVGPDTPTGDRPRDAASAHTVGTAAKQSSAGSDQPAPPTSDTTERNITIDLDTHKVLFQSLDSRTGQVIAQFPDPRYLQAYKDQLRAAEPAEEAVTAPTERVA